MVLRKRPVELITQHWNVMGQARTQSRRDNNFALALKVDFFKRESFKTALGKIDNSPRHDGMVMDKHGHRETRMTI